MRRSTKAKAPVVRGPSQTQTQAVETLPIFGKPAETVKQFLLLTPVALKYARGIAPAALRNTDCGALLGYRRFGGYGEWFDQWTSADGSITAWCGESVGIAFRPRQRLCLAGLVERLRTEVGQ